MRTKNDTSERFSDSKALTPAPDKNSFFFFCGFSMGSYQYWAGRVYEFCVYYMTGTPEGSTESIFMEKPRIEPATPGLQGIALIHYTTGAKIPGSENELYAQTYPDLST